MGTKNAPPAQCLAIIICESVVEDHRTHNKCILNAYNRITSASYPARQDRLTVFISLTDGRDDQPFKVQFIGPDGDIVTEAGGQVRFPDPLAVVDLVLDLRGFPIAMAGNYEVRALVCDTIVGQRRFSAVEAGGGGGQ